MESMLAPGGRLLPRSRLLPASSALLTYCLLGGRLSKLLSLLLRWLFSGSTGFHQEMQLTYQHLAAITLRQEYQ